MVPRSRIARQGMPENRTNDNSSPRDSNFEGAARARLGCHASACATQVPNNVEAGDLDLTRYKTGSCVSEMQDADPQLRSFNETVCRLALELASQYPNETNFARARQLRAGDLLRTAR